MVSTETPAWLGDERFAYRVADVGFCPCTGRMLVRLDVTNGKTLQGLPSLGDEVALAPPLQDRQSLARARRIAWQRMRERPALIPAPQPPAVSRDWESLLASLRGQT
jgi:hypothetical protein